MKQPLVQISIYFVFVLLLAANTGCGSSGNRQLQSISATGVGGIQFQFTATGTFTASPGSVTPLPVSWYEVPAGEDPPFSYSLTSESFSTACQTGESVIALAPTEPNSPATGTIPTQVFEDLVVNHTRTSEGGFVASPPTYIACP